MINFYLNEKEKKELNDLILFNRSLYDYFNDSEAVKLIEEVINEKIDRLSDLDKYRFLNNLYKTEINDSFCREIYIVNGINFDIAKDRTGFLLLENLIKNECFASFLEEGSILGFKKFITNNMLKFYKMENTRLNFSYILDRASLFIVNIIEDDSIDLDVKTNIVGNFLFLYKDLDLEFDLYRLNKKNAEILSKRYEANSNFFYGESLKLKDYLSAVSFWQQYEMMLSISDDDKNMHYILNIGEIYQDCLLKFTSDEGFADIYDSFKFYKKMYDFSMMSTALKHLDNSMKKRKKLSIS